MNRRLMIVAGAALGAGGLSTANANQAIEVIFATGDPVPGGDGLFFDRFDRPTRSPNGRFWAMLARNDGPSATDAMFIIGSATNGELQLQEDGPLGDRIADSMSDRYMSINDVGEWVGLVNLDGDSEDDESIVRGAFGVDEVGVVLQESEAAGPAVPGGILASFNYHPQIANNGQIGYGWTLEGFDSSSDLHYFLGDGSVLVANEAGPGPEVPARFGGPIADVVWDGFTTNSFQADADADAWLLRGDIAGAGVTSANEDVLVVSNQVVAREGFDLGGLGPVEFLTGDENQLTEDGHWFLRGRVDGGIGFAVRSGEVLAAEGDPLPTDGGGGEVWDGSAWTSSSGSTFFVNVGDNQGNYVVGGFTSNPDLLFNAAWAANGERVFLRTGDQVDLDADGALDDAFLYTSSFTTASPKALGGFLADDGDFYFTADIRNAAGDDLGEIFARITITPPPADCPGDANGDLTVNSDDLNIVLGGFGQVGEGLPGDLNADGVVDSEDLNAVLGAFGTVCG